MTEGTSKRKRVVTKKPARQIYAVEGDKVVMKVVPEEVLEVESGEQAADDKLRIKFSTPDGDAIYEYVGECVDCGYKRPPEKTEVFVCKSKARADEQLGVQLASFRRDGRSSSALCKDCYDIWRNSLPKREARFKVI